MESEPEQKKVNIPPKTLATYHSSLKRLTDSGIDYESLESPELLIKNISNLRLISGKNKDSLIKDTTIKTYIVSIIWFHRQKELTDQRLIFIKVLQQAMNRLGNSIQKKSSSRELVGTQIQNYLSWDDIVRKYESIQDVSSVEYVVASLYVCYPPRRLKDYALMYLEQDLEKTFDNFNYYCNPNPDSSYFIFNDYKTKKAYGRQVFKVPIKLHKIISNYIDKAKPTKSLLSMNESQIRNTLNTVFSKQVSVDILRHSFITHMALTGMFYDLEVREKVAQIMAHSLHTQEDYRKDPKTKRSELLDFIE